MGELLGKVLGGHYRLDERIGEGATGIVFRAWHTLLKQDFAVKVLNPNLPDDGELRERFLREARSLTRFTHRNAVQVRHCGEDDGLLYIVMDHCPGETLDEKISRDGPLDEKSGIALMRDVLAAVGAAHDAGIVHRDLKPANIMVEPDGGVKVLDFGLARILATDAVPGKELTIVGGLVGTVAYMSPEQLRAEAVDARSDLFSLGIVLREIVSGQRPFDGGSPATVMVQILEHEPQPLPGDLAASLSAPLHGVLRRALDKDRAKRFQTADEFAAALRAVGGERRAAPAPPPPDRRRIWVACGLVGIALGLAAITYVLIRHLGAERTGELRAEARTAYYSSRFEEADRLYSLVIRAGEATGEDFLGRGRARLELQREQAVADLARAADLLPNDARVPAALGRLRLLQGRTQEADVALRRALEIDAGNPLARRARLDRLFIARHEDIRRWQRETDAEIEQYRKHVGGPRADAMAAYALLLVLQVVPDADKEEMGYRAGLLARKAYNEDPALADAAAALAQLSQHEAPQRRAVGKDSEANELLRKAVEMWEETITRARAQPEYDEQGSRIRVYLHKKIDALKNAHRMEDAIEALDEYVALNPTDAGSLRWAAAFYTLVGGQEKAEEIHERLLGIATNDAQVYFYYATNLQLKGLEAEGIGDEETARKQYRRARDVYGRGRDIDPNRHEMADYYAETCVKLSRVVDDETEKASLLAEAKEIFAAGRDLYRRAEYHLMTGDLRAALADMREQVKLSNPPTLAMLHRLVISMQRVAEEIGAFEEARALLAEALGVCRTMAELDPKMGGPPSDMLRGHVRRSLGKLAVDEPARRTELERALDAYRRAITASADRPRRRAAAHVAAAEILAELGRRDDAVEEARKAMAIREEAAAAGEWFKRAEDRAWLEDLGG